MAASSGQAQTGLWHRGTDQAIAFLSRCVTVLADLASRVLFEVAPCRLSRYVAEKVEERKRRAALKEFLAHHEREYGPVSDVVVQEVLDEWDALVGRSDGSSPGSSSTAKG